MGSQIGPPEQTRDLNVAGGHTEGFTMRNLALGLLLLGSTIAHAATDAPNGQLSPGKPAGVKAAQNWDDRNAALIAIGAAAVGIGIALAVSNDDNGNPPVVTTPAATGTTP